MDNIRKDIDFFKSKQDMYAFALTKTNGAITQRLLKIDPGMYVNPRKATKWHSEVKSILNPNDKRSIHELDTIYRRMLNGGVI